MVEPPATAQRSAAMVVVVAAVMPRMFVIVTVMIAVVIIVARFDHTSRGGRHDCHDHGTPDETFKVAHIAILLVVVTDRRTA
jgi:hypothetical protein